jgi:hypothetical protein
MNNDYKKVNDYRIFTKLFWQEKIEDDFWVGGDDFRYRESEYFVLGYDEGGEFISVTDREDEKNLVYSRVMDLYSKDNHGHPYIKIKRRIVEGNLKESMDYYSSLGVDSKFLKGLEKILSERPRFEKLKFELNFKEGKIKE